MVQVWLIDNDITEAVRLEHQEVPLTIRIQILGPQNRAPPQNRIPRLLTCNVDRHRMGNPWTLWDSRGIPHSEALDGPHLQLAVQAGHLIVLRAHSTQTAVMVIERGNPDVLLDLRLRHHVCVSVMPPETALILR